VGVLGFDFSISWVEEDVLILWFACVFREMNMVADSCAGLAWWLMEDGGRVDVLGWINGTSMLVNDVSSTRAPEESKADNFHVNGDVGSDVGHLVYWTYIYLN
jgi:hypothetical protein